MTGGAAPLRLTAALSRNTYTEPVLHGAARADGLVLDARAMHPSEMFWRQLKNREFDVSEMSLASMFILHAAGNRDWLPLPVFTSRRFFHAHVLVRADVAASRPADLAGLRVGVPEYQQTAAVWARGVLRDDPGHDQADHQRVHGATPARTRRDRFITGARPGWSLLCTRSRACGPSAARRRSMIRAPVATVTMAASTS